MNRFDRRPLIPGEAQVQFLDGDFRILRPGAYVRCAVTGLPIPLDELRYWDVDRQEAYVSPQAKLDRLEVKVKLAESPRAAESG
ncbi:MAG TPA: DUF2093 domain-containing protein [Beijerinckiaceae bacterium]|nr:DUF2093 domain-containing protein [Beijerinckiaceae bacterium]